MTHFVGLVIADTVEEIASLLAPYDENMDVEPYFEPVEVERMVEYAKEKKVEFTNPIDLVDWWNGTPGVTNEAGEIGYMSTYNPDSKWDWYTVGGRWDYVVVGNRCLAEDVESTFNPLGYIPSVIIDADGWNTSKDWGWFGSSTPVEGNENIVREKLAQHKGKNVFIVDFHI
jgi:hypothetical protein